MHQTLLHPESVGSFQAEPSFCKKLFIVSNASREETTSSNVSVKEMHWISVNNT